MTSHNAHSENTLLLTMSTSGNSTVYVAHRGQTLELDFDPGSVKFDRLGDALVIQGENYNTILVQNFFHEGDVPAIIALPNGVQVSGQDFINSVNPDLLTAEAPEPGSGLNSYSDSAGHLIDGISALGTLDGMGAFAVMGLRETSRDIVSFDPAADTTDVMPEPPPDPPPDPEPSPTPPDPDFPAPPDPDPPIPPDPDPPEPPEPPPPLNPVERFIMYLGNDPSALAGRAAAGGIAITGRCPLPGVFPPDLRLENSVTPLGTARLNADGTLTYTLSAAALAVMAGGSRTYDTLTLLYDDPVTGITHTGTIEVVLEADTSYSSPQTPDEHAAEWHQSYVPGIFEVLSGSGMDRITLNYDLVSGTIINTGDAFDAAGGVGGDVLRVNANIDGVGINAGNGNDLIFLGSAAAGHSVSNSTLNLGDGANILVVNAEVDRLAANSGSGGDSLEFMDDVNSSTITVYGNDTVYVHGNFNNSYAREYAPRPDGMLNLKVGGNSDYSVFNGTRNADSLSIHRDMNFSSISLAGGDNILHVGDNVTVSSIYAGNGDDYARFGGNMTGVAHSNGYTSSVLALGDGDNNVGIGGNVDMVEYVGGKDADTVCINGSVQRTHIDLGSGNDSLTINGTMQSGSVSLGANDDVLILHGITGGIINGNDGSDGLILTADGLGSSLNTRFSGLSGISGMETLLFDMSGSTSDILNLDSASLNALLSTDSSEITINGDAGTDKVRMNGIPFDDHWSHNEIVIDNVTYDHWRNQDADLNVYIQTSLIVG